MTFSIALTQSIPIQVSKGTTNLLSLSKPATNRTPIIYQYTKPIIPTEVLQRALSASEGDSNFSNSDRGLSVPNLHTSFQKSEIELLMESVFSRFRGSVRYLKNIYKFSL